MKEIKFRAWDNHYKYMNYKIIVGVYGDWEKVKDDKNYTSCAMWIDPKNVDYKCEPHWSHFEPYHENIKLMQYTGLKDKNGVEIYEGDIVIMHYFFENFDSASLGAYEDEAEIKGVIHINEYGTYVETSDKQQYFWNLYLQEPTEELEVIGNVWENGDLLDDSK